jgi:DNA mismatch endonuclease (patch repair protein)
MRRVRHKDTEPEQAVASWLRGTGARYRQNVSSLPGSPDFANKAKKWALFVHGCFWHRHPNCVRTTTPKRNRAFWENKFKENQARDRAAVAQLRKNGYRVGVVWECQAGSRRALEPLLRLLTEQPVNGS